MKGKDLYIAGVWLTAEEAEAALGSGYPAPKQHVTKTTPELRQGDIVRCHGMRCLIDGEPQKSRSHPGDSTFFYAALVLNRDEVPNAVVPYSFTERDGTDAHRWVIQGNELARWSVEV